ncbi:MAG: response regulator transcription factor [Lachnospiraceae bacterium]|jgi:CheY-like chemotaxis protein|nr:response regulator transcription factor [Lachnospiraceae bacterium]MCI9015505.1 response regulator transcription factor [Lachnospiraceae bacterium]MCI9255095.1 response regulator transcription factor [Lachnospiraceae bacterium]
MKLLLAEDEKTLSEVLVTVLEKNGCSVMAVYDGKI